MARAVERAATATASHGHGGGRLSFVAGGDLPFRGLVNKSNSFRTSKATTSKPPMQQQPPMQQYKRRMTFDVSRQRQPLNHADNAGLFGSFRRLSLDLDKHLKLQDNNNDNNHSVSNYREVFQQMKKENPTASIGALQQKTMGRISELKLQKEQEEIHDRIEQERREEEERLRNQTMAKKYVDKWVGKMCSSRDPMLQMDGADVPLHTINSTESDGSTLQHHKDTSQGNSESHFTSHFIPIPTAGGGRASMLSGGSRSSMLSRRRLSVDTGCDSTMGNTNPDSLLEDTLLSRPNGDLYINAGLVAGGDDQGLNFAPRKSVGDFARIPMADLNADDKSERSFLSDVSGLLYDAESVVLGCCSGSQLSCSVDVAKSLNTLGLEDEEGEGSSSVDKGNISRGKEDSNNNSANDHDIDSDSGQHPQSDYSITVAKMKPPAGSHVVRDELDDTHHYTVASEFTADYSATNSKGLLVGFVDRSEGKDGDRLLVEFVDRNSRQAKKADEVFNAW